MSTQTEIVFSNYRFIKTFSSQRILIWIPSSNLFVPFLDWQTAMALSVTPNSYHIHHSSSSFSSSSQQQQQPQHSRCFISGSRIGRGNQTSLNIEERMDKLISVSQTVEHSSTIISDILSRILNETVMIKLLGFTFCGLISLLLD